jgi:hypothetical protein
MVGEARRYTGCGTLLQGKPERRAPLGLISAQYSSCSLCAAVLLILLVAMVFPEAMSALVGGVVIHHPRLGHHNCRCCHEHRLRDYHHSARRRRYLTPYCIGRARRDHERVPWHSGHKSEAKTERGESRERRELAVEELGGEDVGTRHVALHRRAQRALLVCYRPSSPPGLTWVLTHQAVSDLLGSVLPGSPRPSPCRPSPALPLPLSWTV